MFSIKKLITRLLSPHRAIFLNEFEAAFLQALKETSYFNEQMKGIVQTWLAICPHTFYSELFLEKENWNGPFIQAFDRPDMAGAWACFQVTQAYYLANLSRIMLNDENYSKYSQDVIKKDVQAHVESGHNILYLAAEFEEKLNDASSAEEMPMCYVEKILQKQYPDKESLDSILSFIWADSASILGLTVFYAESMKRTKQIDAQA